MLLYVASKGDHDNLTLSRCTIFLAPSKPTSPHCPSEHIPSLHLPLTRSPRSSLPSYARICCHIRIVSPTNSSSSLPPSRHAVLVMYPFASPSVIRMRNFCILPFPAYPMWSPCSGKANLLHADTLEKLALGVPYIAALRYLLHFPHTIPHGLRD